MAASLRMIMFSPRPWLGDSIVIGAVAQDDDATELVRAPLSAKCIPMQSYRAIHAILDELDRHRRFDTDPKQLSRFLQIGEAQNVPQALTAAQWARRLFEMKVEDPVLLEEPTPTPRTKRMQRDKLSRIWLANHGIDGLVLSGFEPIVRGIDSSSNPLPTFTQYVPGKDTVLVLEPFVARTNETWREQVRSAQEHFHHLALAMRQGEISVPVQLAAYMIGASEKQSEFTYNALDAVPELVVYDVDKLGGRDMVNRVKTIAASAASM